MLTKLLKYEFKATGRLILPLYAALLVTSIVSGLLDVTRMASVGISKSLPLAVVLITIFGLLIAVMYALTFAVVVFRFYKNLLGDEGYLMHTLPLKVDMLIVSKIVTSVCWIVATVIVTVVSSLIMSRATDVFNDLPFYFSQTKSLEDVIFLIETIIFVILLTVSAILFIYTCLCIGHLSNKHKILASFGAYISLTALMQIGIFILSSLPYSSPISELFRFLFSSQISGAASMIVGVSLFIAAEYLATRYILKRKLNLE